MSREKIVKKLNEALERELAEVVKYMHQSFWVQGPKRKKMVAFFREQSQESMGHAIRLGEKIVDMGGVPVVKILEIYEPKAQSMREMLLECVEDERRAKEGYERMIPLVAHDRELSRMIKGLAREEAGHMAEIRGHGEESVSLFSGMREDVAAVMADDPAAANPLQVMLLYSGLHAIWAYRLTHRLHTRGMPFLARALSQLARFLTGVEIHPGARIGRRFFIDHGMGVIIGETAEIGDDCLLYQGVTLGGTGNQSGKRHPSLLNHVVVGSGAKILGNIKIGDHVRVGANSVVLHDVPSNSTVVGIPGRVVRRKASDLNNALAHQNLPDPMMEIVLQLQQRLDRLEGRKKPRKK